MPKVGERYGHNTGVYQWRNTVNGKVYVGGAYKGFDHRKKIHVRDLRAGRHGNEHLQAAWNKYGESAFVFEILERHPTEGLKELETAWIAKKNATDRTLGYNKSPTGGSPLGTKHPPEYGKAISEAWKNKSDEEKAEIKAKIGAASKGRSPSTEARAKISAGNLGKKQTEETKKIISEKLTGRRNTPEVIAKMTEINKANSTKERNEKISQALSGRKQPQDVVNKRAESNRGKKRTRESVERIAATNRGKKRSAESRAKMAVSQKKRFENQEERDKAGAANIGRVLTEEHRAKISAGQLKPGTRARKIEAAREQHARRIMRENGVTTQPEAFLSLFTGGE